MVLKVQPQYYYSFVYYKQLEIHNIDQRLVNITITATHVYVNVALIIRI